MSLAKKIIESYDKLNEASTRAGVITIKTFDNGHVFIDFTRSVIFLMNPEKALKSQVKDMVKDFSNTTGLKLTFKGSGNFFGVEDGQGSTAKRTIGNERVSSHDVGYQEEHTLNIRKDDVTGLREKLRKTLVGYEKKTRVQVFLDDDKIS